jgi:hypothetical protein
MPSFTQAAPHSLGEGKPPAALAATLVQDLERVCKPYVDAFFVNMEKHNPHGVPRASLQMRDSANSHSSKKGSITSATASTLSAPAALIRECSQLIGRAAHPAHARSAVEVQAENVYLRALLLRILQQHPHPQSTASKDVVEAVHEVTLPQPSLELSPRPAAHLRSPEHTHSEGSDSRRSPSAACPEPAAAHPRVHADAVHRALLGGRKTCVVPALDGSETSPATALQVGELQEQIELLREAVRELSQQASMGRGHSASPLPTETRAVPFTLRAVSPSPRCATPTCTNDVPTLQRIVLHQQQTIRTLQLQMEEVESAKMQIEQLLHLHEAAATAGAADIEDAAAVPLPLRRGEMEKEEDDDTPYLAATTNWRSTCHADDRASDFAAAHLEPVSGHPHATGAALPEAAVGAPHDTITAVEEMYKMDFDAAAEAATEKRRAATYGGMGSPSWLDTAMSMDEPIQLVGDNAAEKSVGEQGEEEDMELGDEAPSSGMRTPLPRCTVVLQRRYSSATGDSASVTGRGASDESPVMRPTKQSFGTVSNRHTSAMDSFSAV